MDSPAGDVETEASSRPGTSALGPAIAPAAQPARRGHRRVRRRADVPADVARANLVHAASSRPGGHLALRTCTVPAKPRWLLSIPDAISQLEQLDRQLLTRRDIERLFGVSKARAATLMQTFGAELTGNQRTLPRTKLLQHSSGNTAAGPPSASRRNVGSAWSASSGRRGLPGSA